MKYLLFPLLLIAAVGSNAQTKAITPKKTTAAKTYKKAPAQKDTASTIATLQAPTVYSFVDQMPSPEYNLLEYIGNNIYYPDSARNKNIQGRVIVKFTINEDGSVSDLTLVKGIGYGCDEEAIRVLQHMPPWKPGKQNGNPVRVYYTQPISFKLAD